MWVDTVSGIVWVADLLWLATVLQYHILKVAVMSKKICLEKTTQTEALYLHVPALVTNVFSITVSFVLMVYWSILFVRWRCWHMIIGWGWSCGSVFSAYPLTLPRSICKLLCGFFWFCTLKCSVGGSGANLIILVSLVSHCALQESVCVVSMHLSCFLVFASTKQKIKSQETSVF